MTPLIALVGDTPAPTPVFYGTQVPVHELTTYLRAGKTIEGFLEDFPVVKRQQVEQFLTAAEALVVAAADALSTKPIMQLADYEHLNPEALQSMPDDELWKIVEDRPASMDETLLQAASPSAQESTLQETDREARASLLKAYHHFVLIRSQALLLLKQRGYNLEARLHENN